MKNLSKTSEDRFEYEISNGECTITGYIGDSSERCVIPEEIGGCSVTAVAKYAFCAHKELSYVGLPGGLRYIGAHAFYNCRNLEHIAMHDILDDIGDGAFKNCAGVNKIEIIRGKGSTKCLKALLEEMNQEMLVMIHYEKETAALIFPYYMHEYEENTPGRIINQITIGSGVHYRETVGADNIDYAGYDRIFEVEKNIDVQEAAWKVAYWRLRCPYMLSGGSEESYRQYLKERSSDISAFLIKKEQYEELKVFLDMALDARSGLERIIENARQNGMVKAVGFLLEYERKRWQVNKKSYDFG